MIQGRSIAELRLIATWRRPAKRHLNQVTNGLAVRMAGAIPLRWNRAMNAALIRNGRIVDPANGRDEIADPKDG
jgi:hypothetical protein